MVSASADVERAQPAPHRRLRWYVVFVACDLVVALVALVVLLTRDGHSDSPRSRSVADPTRSAAVALSPAQATMVGWAVDELPHSSTLLADPQLATTLRAKGFTVIAPADASGRTIQFVVSTPALRAQAKHYRAAAEALSTSVPVAVAGSGRDGAVVRQVGTVSSARMASDFRTRQASENQLLTNPAFTSTPRAADLLRAGVLDLRAATVLALVSATQPVHLVRINVDPAESLAARPARSIDVTAASTAKLKQVTAHLSPEYRLASWRKQSDGTVRLVWPVDARPVSQP